MMVVHGCRGLSALLPIRRKNMIDLNRNLPKEYDGYRGRDLALRYLQLNGIKTKEQPKLWKDRVAEAEAKKKQYQQESLFEVRKGYEYDE